MIMRYIAQRASVVALTLTCTGFSMLCAAQTGPTTVHADLAAAAKARSAVEAQATAARANAAAGKLSASNIAVPGKQPAEYFLNPDRAYPPSCLNAPLLSGQSGGSSEVLTAQINLIGDPNSSDADEVAFTETDTVTLFRVDCSGGTSATLLEIDRPTGFSTTLYPTFPGVSVAQGSNDVNIRLALDPNTFYSTTYALTPVVAQKTVYVLENFYGATAQYNYNQAFVLTVDNLNSQDPARLTTFTMGAYVAPTAPALMAINGYMSTNWSSQTQSGEGIIMQIYDDRDDVSYTLAFAWFTYDAAGHPFWLYGQASFAIGQTQVSVPTVYYEGGTFVGTAPNGVPSASWGVVQFTFPDCNHMNVVYNTAVATPQGPATHGATTFVRVANINGIVCQ